MPEAPGTGEGPAAAVARLLTPAGEGGIAVIALSGPGAAVALARLFGARAGRMTGGAIAHGWLAEDGRRLDEALVWRVEAGFEIGLHGGSAPAAAVVRALRRAGVRVETAPAVGAGIEAEAAALLPRAATLAAAAFPAAAADGALTREIESGDPVRLQALLDRAAAGAALAVPRRVAIAGPPNAGKSTLLNALCGRDRALVHPQAGTTRDPVEGIADVEGYPILFTDTAGLTGTASGIDAEAEALARETASGADAVLWLAGSGAPPPDVRARIVLRLSAKSDLGPRVAGALPVSGLTGEGLPGLKAALLAALALPFPADARPAPFLPRHVEEIRRRRIPQ